LDRNGHDNFELLIFDWDGTLFDSIGSIVACTMATMEELKIEGVSEHAVRQTIGLGLPETLEMLFPNGNALLRQRVREVYFHLWPDFRDRPSLFRGTEATLQSFAEAGYLLAVATGKSRMGLSRDMERSQTAALFATTRTVDEAPSKPHPAMVLDILDELGLRPHQALVVGDTTYDLLMAKNAGAPAVGVTSGSHPREQLLTAEPLDCLDSVLDLGAWLAGR
jgi:phosphoglycolate phosphatase